MPHPIPKQIRESNRLLATELGRLSYRWMWSEDLLIEMRAMHDDGTRKFDYRNTPSGIAVAVPVYEHRKLLTDSDHQWILCRLTDPPSEREWNTMFGTDLQYPNGGMWYPCQSPLGPIALPPHRTPTVDDTREVIKILKAELYLTAEQVINDGDEQQAKAQKDQWNLAYQQFKDCAPAFGGVPEWKTHWSFGGVKDTELDPTKKQHKEGQPA